MDTKKILIIGADGQLAFDLIRVLKPHYHLIEARHSDFDVADVQAVNKFITSKNPDIIINTAAYNKTEECERNPEKSFHINALGAYYVACAGVSIGSRNIFLSTNYVFDGSKQSFTENDCPHPLNVYGASKYAGEMLVAIADAQACIIRTSILFGISHQSGKGYNFVSLMLKKAKKGEEIRVVNDEFGSPTYAWDLACAIKEFVGRNVPAGTYHVTNAGSCSWYAFASKIFELSCVQPKKLIPIHSQESGSRIARPLSTILVNNRLASLGIRALRPWEEALGAYLDEAVGLDAKKM